MKSFQANAIKRINMESKAAKEKILMLTDLDWDCAHVYFNVQMYKYRETTTGNYSITQDLGCCV